MSMMARGVAIALAATISVLVNADAVAAPKPAPPIVGAGYVTTPTRLQSATVGVQVPRVRCSAQDGSLTLAIFMQQRGPKMVAQIPIGLTITCRGGRASYRSFIAGSGMRNPVIVHGGDRLRLTRSQRNYAIDDMTSGSGAGGGSTSGAGSPTLVRRVLIGVQVRGVMAATRVLFTDAQVNDLGVGRVRHARQAQYRQHRALATAGLLAGGQRFVVYVR